MTPARSLTSRLPRRSASRNDGHFGCHCERSEAISVIADPVPTVRFVPLDPFIRVFGIKKLSNLYSSLKWRLVKRPDGSTLADDYIASTLGVASLPYT